MNILRDICAGRDHPVFIIAEAGVNHCGNAELAFKMVDIASETGADAVKFQTFKAEKIAAKGALRAGYQKETAGIDEDQREMLRKLELPLDVWEKLYKHCRNKGIAFLSTPFDFESADLLEGLGAEAFKIGSGEVTNLPLLKHIAGKKKPVILSTGMSTLGEVEEAVDVLHAEGANGIILLHCTSSYPTKYEDVNLKAMSTLKNAFGLPVGYSDHTPGFEVVIAAVSRGAVVVEKHFTLDKNLPGPDHRSSMEPGELAAMVKAIRNVEKSFGDGIKRPSPGEMETREVARKSIVAARSIPRGAVLESGMLTVKRPGLGISPKYLDLIIGKRLIKGAQEDEVITWEHLIAGVYDE